MNEQLIQKIEQITARLKELAITLNKLDQGNQVSAKLVEIESLFNRLSSGEIKTTTSQVALLSGELMTLSAAFEQIRKGKSLEGFGNFKRDLRSAWSAARDLTTELLTLAQATDATNSISSPNKQRLIADTQTAIRSLEEERLKLEKMGQSTRYVDSQLKVLSSAFAELTGQSQRGSVELARAEVQLTRFFEAAKRGENIRLTTPWGRVRSGILSQTQFGDATKAAEDFNKVSQADVTTTTGGVVNLTGQLKRDFERIKEDTRTELDYFNQLFGESNEKLKATTANTAGIIRDLRGNFITEEERFLEEQKAIIGRQSAQENAANRESIRRIDDHKKKLLQKQKEKEELIRNSARNEFEYLDRLEQEIVSNPYSAVNMPAGKMQFPLREVIKPEKFADQNIDQAVIQEHQRRYDVVKRLRDTFYREENQGLEVSRRVAQEERAIERERTQSLLKEIQEREKILRELSKNEARRRLGQILPGGEEAFNNLDKQARKINPMFTPDKIKDVVSEESTGIARVRYQMEVAEGIFRTATLTVDRFGHVLVDTQRRFRGFADAIGRDTVEFLKWTIAASLIIGPLQKLGELTGIMIKNEATLADVTVALGTSQKTTAEVFLASAKIAEDTAEALDGVITAYNQAYRATGSVDDANKRFAITNKLLADSIILAKLSTLDQAESIDTLTAALKQAKMDLTEGETLLNKWVAVTKVANVDLTTLATGFAILGDAAESAGVKTDELNVVIALLAESGIGSAKEVANAARAILGGFQTDKAREQLANLGVSLVDTTGKSKNFLDLIREINALRQSGIISQEQFTELSADIGGGVRRQAVVSSLFTAIANQDKYNKLLLASQEATATTGDAQSALAIKLDTVQSAATNAQNAFIELAQTLGTEGGLLDVFKLLLQLLTGATKGLTELMGVLGRSGPILVATVGLIKYLSSHDRLSPIQNAIGDFGTNRITPELSRIPFFRRPTTQVASPNGEDANLQRLTRAEVVGNAVSRIGRQYGISLAASMLPALETLITEGFNESSMKRAGGSVAGGIVGTLISAGNPIGGIIGASIGEALIKYVQDKKANFANLFPETPKEVQNPDELTPEQRGNAAIEKAVQALGGPLVVTAMQGVQNLMLTTQNATRGTNFAPLTYEQTALKMLHDAAQQPVIPGRRESPLVAAKQRLYDEIMKELQAVAIPQNIANASSIEVENKYKDFINKSVALEKDVLDERLRKRVLSIGQYRTGTSQLDSGFSAAASQYFSAFGEGFQGSPQKFFDISARIIGEGKPEEKQVLTEYKDRINAVNAELLKLSPNTAAYNEQVAKKNQLIREAVQTFNDLNQAILSQGELLKNVDFSQYSLEEFRIIEEEGVKAWDAIIEKNIELGKITREQAEAMKAAAEETLVMLDAHNLVSTKIPSEFLQMGKKAAEETSKISTKNIGFSSQDMTQAQYQQATSLYGTLLKQLEALGYKEQKDDSIVILKDGFIKEQRDSKIIQYLLQQIEENTQKLTGAYNLPEGSSFWVPFQAALLQSQSSTMAGLKSFLAPGTTETSTAKATQERISTQYTMDAYDKKMQKWEDRIYKPIEDKGGIPHTYTRPPDEVTRYEKSAREALRPPGPVELSGFQKFLQDLLQNFKIGANYGGVAVPSSVPTQPPLDLSGLTKSIQNMSTKLSLQIDNKTTVLLDGRVIASVIKTYLKNDLIKFSGGTGTKPYSVI